MGEPIDTLPALVRRAAHRWPDRIAWEFPETGDRLSFADIEVSTAAYARQLAALGVGPGDRVAVMLGNRPEFALSWLALGRLGAAMVPVNTGYRRHDATGILAHSQVRLAITEKAHLDLLATIQPDTTLEKIVDCADLSLTTKENSAEPAVVAETVANIQYTSGTTGAPKGCVLPQRYWTTLAASLVEHSPKITADDIILTAQPFHYIDPQWNVALSLLSGCKLVVLDRFHPRTFWADIERHRVTWFYCLGLMPKLLLEMPPARHDRKHVVRTVCASAIPTAIHRALEERFGVPWVEAFGMTETGADLRVFDDDHDHAVGTTCLGRPVPGKEAMVVDDADNPVPRGVTGELVLRGAGMMHGYFRDQEATAKAFRGGWFHTGDLVSMDTAGRVYYAGRTKDMIRRSGENIAALEVETVLAQHAGVRVAAVVPEPDDLRGEEVYAVVQLHDGVTHSPEELTRFCADRLAAFKVPRYWAYVDQMPLTPSERVAKKTLRETLRSTRRYDRARDEWVTP
ncbi:AMP-binding protein [Fodinicola feengrottensis]|uniref:ATP-dependent acyl-CoA ligase n=1 Tax=Fodinicola feengrottensis TaxID=435914 RepID=A0ABN2JD65_9ACTN|nr:AMP-binding protein [Fodinicola feengrottensis]